MAANFRALIEGLTNPNSEIRRQVAQVRGEHIEPHLAQHTPAYSIQRLSQEIDNLLVHYFQVAPASASRLRDSVIFDSGSEEHVTHLSNLYALLWVFRLNGLEREVHTALN